MIGRAIWLCGDFTLAALDYVWSVTFFRKEPLRAARALWLHRNSRRVLRVARVSWRTSGPIPRQGLLVSNHLSYVDILVLAANTPCAFVAKYGVKYWPVLGWFAQMAGTVFVKREKRTDVARTTSEIQKALNDGALLVLFPEGTSSGGETVLPFKSALLEPATKAGQSLYISCIGYRLTDGSVPNEVCYWRDMTLLPHLLNLLGKHSLEACIAFTRLERANADRKTLAKQLHAVVCRLKNGLYA